MTPPPPPPVFCIPGLDPNKWLIKGKYIRCDKDRILKGYASLVSQYPDIIRETRDELLTFRMQHLSKHSDCKRKDIIEDFLELHKQSTSFKMCEGCSALNPKNLQLCANCNSNLIPITYDTTEQAAGLLKE